MADPNNDSFPLFSIPGNIKQRFLPFLLDPSQSINDFGTQDNNAFAATAANASPQLFTYRASSGSSPGGTAYLGFFPSTSFPSEKDDSLQISHLDLNEDLSFRLVYGPYEGPKHLTISDIVETLPCISIREFLPDTRLDQCINFFKEIFSKVSNVAARAMDVKGDNTAEKNENLINKIWACTKFAIAYMLGIKWDGNKTSFLKEVFNENIVFRNELTQLKDPNGDIQNYVHTFPFALYYRLQTCTTTNIYEVPAMCDGKPIMSSDGKPGWGDGSDFMSAGGFRVSGLLNKIPMVGDLANMILGNIGVNYMPWWNAESGAKVAAPEVTVKFDLFNDNVYKALMNFIFVNTLVPSNKWIQYNMFQHSSNLYDVKIEGINRLFACAASFEVTYEGVLRDPPNNFFELLKKHFNTNMFEQDSFLDYLKKNKVIKIPDIYRVSMSFKSILPANFNNFLYTWTQNYNHMTLYNKDVNDKGFGENIRNGINKFVDGIKEKWGD